MILPETIIPFYAWEEVLMQPLNTLTGTELVWKPPKFGAELFELNENDDLFAKIYWTKLFSDAAIGQVADGWWTFDRLGWLRDRIVATIGASEQVSASFEFDWLKSGLLQLANGREFKWYRTKPIANAWALVETEGNAFLEIEHGFHWFKQRAWVTLNFPVDDPDLPLLICFTMYLIYCINQDNAAAAAATSAVAAVS